MNVLAIIPARYGSTRFPAKALASIAGKSLIEWVWRGTRESALIQDIYVATDHAEIEKACHAFGAQVAITSAHHESGTDRVAEALGDIQPDWVLNVQGDEILIRGAVLDEFIQSLGKLDTSVGMATMARPMTQQSEINDPSMVKVVMDNDGKALYFSRAPIPFHRDAPNPMQTLHYWHHIGIYAYRPECLRRFVALPQSSLEKIEKLEQLRALQNGIAIQVMTTNFVSVGIDTPHDVERVRELLGQ